MRSQLCLLALVLILAACGGTDAGQEVEPGADASSTTAAPETTAPAETSTTTTTEAETTTSTAEPEGDAGQFCEILREAQDVEMDVTDPAQMETVLREDLERLYRAREVAPAEIADEFAGYVAFSEDAFELYEQYGFDLEQIPEEESEALFEDSLEVGEPVGDYCEVGAGG